MWPVFGNSASDGFTLLDNIDNSVFTSLPYLTPGDHEKDCKTERKDVNKYWSYGHMQWKKIGCMQEKTFLCKETTGMSSLSTFDVNMIDKKRGGEGCTVCMKWIGFQI